MPEIKDCKSKKFLSLHWDDWVEFYNLCLIQWQIANIMAKDIFLVAVADTGHFSPPNGVPSYKIFY